ncbi:MAG TPA: nuclear transport factor 2 family protein [Verrucomicrobiota bacterium]|nr:hypothetical protein [Verrucomicrobiales bacterium]HRI14311.1 nuclear transport factor 2 family protein [Verrucomicrobiota bacterium]
MKLRIVLSSLVVGLFATGCVGVSVNRNSGSSTKGSASDGSANSMKLLAVDVEFAHRSATQGAAKAFSHYTDANSLRLTATGLNAVGREAFIAEFRDLPDGALTWTPRHAEVSAAGDLGWTWGDFVFRGPQGERQGRYVTVWRWRDGQWWIAADIGTAASN